MIQPLPNRLIVKVLPRYESKLNLTFVDKKKHYEDIRRGEVIAVGRYIREIRSGEIVWFHGDEGDSFGSESGMANDGTDYRRLKQAACLAVEEGV